MSKVQQKVSGCFRQGEVERGVDVAGNGNGAEMPLGPPSRVSLKEIAAERVRAGFAALEISHGAKAPNTKG